MRRAEALDTMPAAHRLGILFGLVAALIWGGYIAATRFATNIGLTAEDIAFLRYVTAGLMMAPWLARHRPLSLAGIGWTKGAGLALLAGPPFVLVGASGFLFSPLAHSAVIQLGSVALLGVLFAAILNNESLSRRRVIGLLVIVAGLTITAGPGLFSGGSQAWKGDMLFALAGGMWALFTALQTRWKVAAVAATAVVSVLSALVYAPIYLAMSGSGILRFDIWLLVELAFVLGVLSGIIALFAFARAVELLGAGRASVFPTLAPGFAIIIGIPLAAEVPTALQVAGLLVLTVGLLLTLRNDAEHKAPENQAS